MVVREASKSEARVSARRTGTSGNFLEQARHCLWYDELRERTLGVRWKRDIIVAQRLSYHFVHLLLRRSRMLQADKLTGAKAWIAYPTEWKIDFNLVSLKWKRSRGQSLEECSGALNFESKVNQQTKPSKFGRPEDKPWYRLARKWWTDWAVDDESRYGFDCGRNDECFQPNAAAG